MASAVIVDDGAYEQELYEEMERLQRYLQQLTLQNSALAGRLMTEMKRVVDVTNAVATPQGNYGKRATCEEEEESMKRTRPRERDTEDINADDDGSSADEDSVQHFEIRTTHVAASRSAASQAVVLDDAPPVAVQHSASSSSSSSALTVSQSSLPGCAGCTDAPLEYRAALFVTAPPHAQTGNEGHWVDAELSEGVEPVTYRSLRAESGCGIDEWDMLAAQAAAALPESSARSSYLDSCRSSSYQEHVSTLSYYADQEDDGGGPLYRSGVAEEVAVLRPASRADSADSANAATTTTTYSSSKPSGGKDVTPAAAAATTAPAAAAATTPGQKAGKCKEAVECEQQRDARKPNMRPACAAPAALDLGLLRELVDAVGALVVSEGEAATRLKPSDDQVGYALDRLALLSV